MSKLLLSLFLVLGASMAVAAPPTDASIDQLLEASHSRQTLERSMAMVDSAIRKGVDDASKTRAVSAAQQAALDKAVASMSAAMRDEMGWDKIHPIFVENYRDSFTQEEVDALTAFYRTPIGQSIVAKLPVVQQRAMAAIQTRLTPMMQRMQAAVSDALKSDSAPAPGAPQ